MIYDEAIALLEGMRDRASSNSLSSSDKAYIKSLYFEICGKHVRNSSCNDCYMDAYIETYLTLKKQGKMVQQNYILKAGAIISRFGDNNFYALSNCPDEVAEEWLKEDPTRIGLFEKFPEDWQKRIASSEQQGDGADAAQADKKTKGKKTTK